MFAHIVEGRLRHPAVTEAVRQRFLDSPEYRKAARCAVRFQSAPKAGGIEIIALSNLPAMPLCRQIRLSADKKWLLSTFNGTKYWLPVDGATPEEVYCLILSSKLNAPRLCIDIAACGPFYTIQVDGGIGLGMDVTKTIEQADFLLGAMTFGRDAHTGVLYEPKQRQLPGYKNPILETARLLQQDAEYASERCQYIDAWPYPTLVFDNPLSLPADEWWNIWPKLEFPKPFFRVTWRLVLVDLLGKQAFYDIPDDFDKVDEEAKVLLRPYQALMESVRKHGTDWIASEPDLRKVDQYARIFQVLSLARKSSNLSDITFPSHIPLPSMSSSTTVYKRADFRLPLSDSTEIDVLGQALESAFTTAIVSNLDDLTRAAQYNSLGVSCFRQKKFDKAILHFLQAARTYDGCLQQHSSDSKSDRATETDCAKEGRRDSFTSILESICQASTAWVFQKDETKYPQWWKPLQDQFGQTLGIVTRVLKEPRFLSMDESRFQIAVPLVVDVLLVHLAQEMLIEFEKFEDLDGIHRICNFMEGQYKRMEDQGIPIDKDSGGNVGRRWSSIEQASRDLKGRLSANTDQADPFKVLEKVLQNDDDVASSFTKQKQQQGNTSNAPNHPLADLIGTSHSNSQRTKRTASEGTVAQAEWTIDAYFIQGDIAASLACALVLVDDQHLAAASTHADRSRLWAKANLIAEYALAQRNLLSARELVEGVKSTLSKKLYKTSVMENKTAMLSYLTEACTLLGTCKRLFPKASEVLQGVAYRVMATVHQAWLDNDTASKWTEAAKAREEAAKSESDDAGAMLYSREWLLNEENKYRKDAFKCTKEWQAMVATLIL
ncbi:hypothetical protein K457DRAFT_143219 [Linnemannia elongata AG-77]|uniref:Uncharacterized protein n=1 Tax=Linnemannia elongata AG-77 TaxID=1314771 RepID=A0A197JEE8_9FUNG|nr:hypothetical protein K457DRAFT_143219 [Linnemannia elongata AG-77]